MSRLMAGRRVFWLALTKSIPKYATRRFRARWFRIALFLDPCVQRLKQIRQHADADQHPLARRLRAAP